MNSLFSDYACRALDSNCICQHSKKHFGFSKTTVDLILPFQKRKIQIFRRLSKLNASEVP